MEATGIAAYCWIMADDTLTWSSNAGEVLAAAPDMISSGRRYASLIDPSSGTATMMELSRVLGKLVKEGT